MNSLHLVNSASCLGDGFLLSAVKQPDCCRQGGSVLALRSLRVPQSLCHLLVEVQLTVQLVGPLVGLDMMTLSTYDWVGLPNQWQDRLVHAAALGKNEHTIRLKQCYQLLDFLTKLCKCLATFFCQKQLAYRSVVGEFLLLEWECDFFFLSLTMLISHDELATCSGCHPAFTLWQRLQQNPVTLGSGTSGSGNELMTLKHVKVSQRFCSRWTEGAARAPLKPQSSRGQSQP